MAESYPVLANCKHHVRQITAIGLLFSLVLPTGCAKKTFDDIPATIAPAQAVPSPPLTRAPAGSVRPLAGLPHDALFDGRTRLLAVMSPGADSTAPASLTVMECAANITPGDRATRSGDRPGR